MAIPQPVLHSVSSAIGRIGCGLAAVFMFMVFAVSALAALYLYLRNYLPPAESMGLVAVVAGFAGLVAGWWATTREKQESHPPSAAAIDIESVLTKAVAKDPLGLVIGAVAAGIVMESFPEVGNLLRRLIGDRT